MISRRFSAVFTAMFLGLAALPIQAQSTGPIQYQLENTSRYSEGCYPPCLCPVFFNGMPTGTFDLRYSVSDPAGYTHYDVMNVDWLVGVNGTVEHVTGSGQYRHGGQFVVQEELTLDLSVNGAAPEHFDSGLVIPQSAFPRIDITISINGMYCYDKVYSLFSAPNVAGTPFCTGDGSGTACPCGNTGAPGNGCANSLNPAGANLVGNGLPSLSSDSVVLASTGTPSAPVLFFQGTLRANGGAGVVFGDGLRCAAGNVQRLRIEQAVNGASHVPGPLDPPLSVIGGISLPGTYDYQTWYRNSATFCTPAVFNLANGYEIVWTP